MSSSFAPAKESVPEAAQEVEDAVEAPTPAAPVADTLEAPPLEAPPLEAPDETEEPIDEAALESDTTYRVSDAGSQSVLKRAPGAWRSPDANSSEQGQAAPKAGASSRTSAQPIVTQAPTDFHETGSGRATPSRERSPARQPQAVAASSELPSLRVHTTGPAAVILGREATWKVEIENAGATVANEVTISIHLPSSVEVVGTKASLGNAGQGAPPAEDSVLTWTIPQLAARAQARLDVRAVPKSAGSFELRADWKCRPNPIAAHVEVQEPKLEIAISGPAEVNYGETHLYTVVFSNPGTGDAENVKVALSPLSPGDRSDIESTIGMIPAGGKKQMQIEFVARQAGTMEIKLRATGDDSIKTEAAKQVKVKRAQLAVAVRGPSLHYAGVPAMYKITVSNVGDAPASDVSLAAALPPGAKPAENSIGGAAWKIGDMDAGAERVIEFACEFTAGGEITIAAHAEAADNLSASGEAITQVEAIAELKLAVNDPRGAQPVGEDAVYEVVVTNRGTRAAQNVEVLGQFSEGIEPVAAAGAPAELVVGQVIFKPLAQIAPGQSLTLKITARAEKAGDLVFRAEVRCTDPETKLVSESTTRYFGEAATP
jgi:uncharacterized repeat protein (TIGR01451 family)